MSDADQKVDEAIEAKAEEIAAVKTEIADAVIEASQQRIENAEAVAQEISDAVVMTEMGRRIDGLANEVMTWRGECEALKLKLSSLEATLTDLSAKLPPNLIAPTLEAPPSPPKGSSIPQASDKTEIVLADNPLSGDVDDQKAAETGNKKRRRFAL